MIQKEITICGKKVNVAYCWATEISYKILADEDLPIFIKEVIQHISATPPTLPDAKRSIFLIIAAMQAYYDSISQEMPVTDKDIMYNATAEELCYTIGIIAGMHGLFYKTPEGEPDDKKTKKTKRKGKGKNS